MHKTEWPVVRILATPQDMNLNGSAFGGWLLGLMDQAAAVTGVALSGGPVATVAVKEVSITDRVGVGEVVSIFSESRRAGRTSIELSLDVFAEIPAAQGSRRPVAAGTFVVVAVDASGTPREIETA